MVCNCVHFRLLVLSVLRIPFAKSSQGCGVGGEGGDRITNESSIDMWPESTDPPSHGINHRNTAESGAGVSGRRWPHTHWITLNVFVWVCACFFFFFFFWKHAMNVEHGGYEANTGQRLRFLSTPLTYVSFWESPAWTKLVIKNERIPFWIFLVCQLVVLLLNTR